MTETSGAAAPPDEGPVRFMRQHIALEYTQRVSPLADRFGGQLRAGRIMGQRCPSCGLVFVPPRAFCPICVVAMGADHELELAHTGTVTSFTVLTPIQYHGQNEREDYALATVLIDGADGTVGQQRLVDVPLDQVRMGMRVVAVWAPPDERGGRAGDRGYGFGNAVRGWRPTGEPDVAPEEFAEHVL
ncbi:MAG: Zn-ribbon domain-containing OB-fold protein [Acidimicrobiales bacterium]